jgi:hypothetical protein
MSDSGSNNPVLTSHYNNFALHAIAISLSVADNALLQYAGGDSKSSIVTINHPLPYSLSTTTSNSVSTATTTGINTLFM